MLSRAADNIYWMARYVERAENLARLLVANVHNAMLTKPPETGPRGRNGTRLGDWELPLLMTGSLNDFVERYETVTQARVLGYMVLDRQNPASIRTAIGCARENARATRHLLAGDLWESLNQTWLEFEDFRYQDLTGTSLEENLEWIRDRAHLFRGAVYGSMRRSEGFFFACAGASVERADNTARLLRIKCDLHGMTNPATAHRGNTAFYDAAVLLHALNAYKAYREIYSAHIEFSKIVDLLVLRTDMPRSLLACMIEITDILARLEARGSSIKTARALSDRLRSMKISHLLRVGLEHFLDEFINRVTKLSAEIQRDFLMTP